MLMNLVCHVGVEFESIRIKLTEYFHILLGLFLTHLKKHNWSLFCESFDRLWHGQC